MCVWVKFYNKHTGALLGGYTRAEESRDERSATIELLAYEHGLKTSEVEVKIEQE